MKGFRAIVAAFRAQNLLAQGEFDSARAVLEDMYLRYGTETQSPLTLRVYAHINLLYATCLQRCGEKAAAIRAYSFVLDQIRNGMRWPGRPCRPDELKYIRCFIRHALIALSSDPDDPAFALALSVASDCCQFDWKQMAASRMRMFPLEAEQIRHNESIAKRWIRRKGPPVVH